MKYIKRFSRVTALILTLSLFICGQPWTNAAAQAAQSSSLSEKYLSDVRLFVSKTVDGAKADAKAQGYEVYGKNMNDDGDEFSTVVLLGYKTTENKDDAITDLSLLDMKLSGYTIVDIGQEEDKLLPQFSEQAGYYLQQALTFREYEKKKTVGSLYAKDMLDYFYIEQNKERKPLSEFILSDKCDLTFFQRMLAKMNPKFIPVISTALTIGSSDPESELWIDRMNNSNISQRVKEAANGWTAKDGTETKPDELMWIDLAYNDKAYTIYKQLKSFANVYKEAVQVKEANGFTAEEQNALAGKAVSQTEKELENMSAEEAASAVELEVVNRFNAYAGGKAVEKTDGGTDVKRDPSMIYQRKQYISGVYVGVGKTHAKAVADVYAKLTAANSGKNMLLSELDEVILYPLSTKAGKAWFCKDNAAEDGEKYAYIGVTRTDSRSEALYGLMKYYSNSDNPPDELTVEDAKSNISVRVNSCGSAIDAPDGKFTLYACHNSAAAQYLSPITHIAIDSEIYKPSETEERVLTDASGAVSAEKHYFGYNPVVTATKDQLKSNYLDLKARPNETCYIHLGYDVSDQPYIEAMYIATGKDKNEAYTNLLKRTSAYIASGVDLNYNAESNVWIAFGYRRHSKAENCITDTMVYIGSDPPKEFSIDRAAKGGGSVKVRYLRASDISLNQGTNGDPMYLYYTRQQNFSGASALTDICFGYNDRTPDDIDPVTNKPAKCEYVLSARDYNSYPNGKLRRCDFNTYVVPKVGKWHMSDHRVYVVAGTKTVR